MRIVDNPISLDELRAMAEGLFGNMVKAVVDVDWEETARAEWMIPRSAKGSSGSSRD